MPERIFVNTNGNTYYILFGENTWWQGNYFEDFEEAYKSWKGNKNE